MNIFLSPHHDDICFSLGHLARQRKGELVNIYTISHYVADIGQISGDLASRVAFITELRRKEDMLFVASTGLRRHDLRFSEPAVAGRRSFTIDGLHKDVDDLSEKLIPYLLALLPDGSTPDTANLFCPMGIGGHRNHLSTLLAVRNAYAVLSARCAIFLYEDLHYASKADVRQAGLTRAKGVFPNNELSYSAIPLSDQDVAQKMKRIGFYESQHRYAPQISDFTPASDLSHQPHEAVWRISSRASL
jgi:hypothetical protein